MAAELPYASDPNHKPPAPPAPPAATTSRVSRTTVAILVFLAVNLALSIYRVYDDRGMVVFMCVSHLNLALLFCAIRCFLVAPQGSPASGRAKLAGWLLTATLTAGFTWKVGSMMPPGIAVVGWVMAAASVGGGFCVLFLLDDEKRSDESGDCERDQRDLYVLAA